MGSSTASTSDTIINTSTDSASTMITNVTHTDNSETCDSLDLGNFYLKFVYKPNIVFSFPFLSST